MAKTNVWMSVSDLMTGLMVIFLFVSIAYMVRAQKLIQQRKQELTEYVDTKNKLYDELHETFKQQIGNDVLAINNDLSMRFAKAESLFDNGQWNVSARFENTLEDVIPVYMNVLLHDSLRTHIKEIRVEGHTDTKPFGRTDSDPYLSNLDLSQKHSYTHALDADGNYAAESRKPIDMDRSKRVEIRIITDDYRVLKEIVKE